MKKQTTEQQRQPAGFGVPPSGGPPPIRSIEWRRLPDGNRCYLVAIMGDGKEIKVATPDGHVPTV